MKNRVGQVYEARKLNFIERELLPLKEHQVLVKIKASCICGSDLHIYKDAHPSVKLPVTVGHEFTGIVQEVGGAVTKFLPGDRVVVEPTIACGHCESCRKGAYGYCENISFTYRQGDGSMADFFIGEEERIYSLPNSVDFEKGALTEPLAVAVHAVKRAGVGIGKKVAVIGAGAIGIMIAAVCKRLGASEIVVSDYSMFRLEMARNLSGARTVYAREENAEEVVAALSQSKGFDIVFECVGLEQTINQAMRMAKSNGMVVDVGIFEKPTIQIDASLLVKKELRMIGSQGYCWDFEDALQLLTELPLEQLLTHRFPLEELESAFRTAADINANAVKVCVCP